MTTIDKIPDYETALADLTEKTRKNGHLSKRSQKQVEPTELDEQSIRPTIHPLRFAEVKRSELRDGTPAIDARIGWQTGAERTYRAIWTGTTTPKRLRELASRILAETRHDSVRPMILAPYLKAASMEELLDQDISSIDWCGNSAVTEPEHWLVYRHGNSNRWPRSTPIKRVFAGRSALIPRILMLRIHFPSLTDLTRALPPWGRISLSTASKVVAALEDEMLVKNSRQDGIEVIDASALLDRIAGETSTPIVKKRQQVKISGGLSALVTNWPVAAVTGTEMIAVMDDSAVQAGLAEAAALPVIWTNSIADFMQRTGSEETTRFATAEIREVDDLALFLDMTRRADGTCGLSALSAYLLLMRGDKRDRQAATETLRARILQPSHTPK